LVDAKWRRMELASRTRRAVHAGSMAQLTSIIMRMPICAVWNIDTEGWLTAAAPVVIWPGVVSSMCRMASPLASNSGAPLEATKSSASMAITRPAVATVEATITDLRVGTWVYASPVRPAWSTAWEAHSLSVLTEGRFEMGIGTGRPGIAQQLRELGLPDVPMNQRWDQVRAVVTALRELDGPDLHTPVAMAVGGPKGLAVAAELADTVTFVMPHTETRTETMQRVRDLDNRRAVELALHVPVIGDSVAPFMAGPDTDAAAIRAADSLAFLPGDPAAAAEEILRRREEIGFSYFVFGADVAGVLAPVVAELAGR